ncbi:lytic transglycosylase domain-containing protein [uncultured Dialister sp.]|jgi:soluble lytic murein transglycosylase|uniref:lytic transglycosylase domain-containing protein n=1 Tax=uncultured Dialister sp. TaxID=278064 RepID=UPI0025F503BB|nr:lytic transglycosylase domain-containing protein [uncultured Dialister sp.]
MRIALKRRKKEVQRHQGNTGAMVFTLLLAIFCVIFLFTVDNIKLLRPSEQVSHIIIQCAEEENISPSLLEAVILTESKFDEKAVSHVGAVGMMQLMPDTAHWISEESGLPSDNLASPDQNIPLGAWYLNYLLKKYHNNEVFALAAYNAGRGNVDEWIEKNKWPEGFTDMEKIPFPETREFVKSVVTARDRLEAEKKGK